MALIKYEGDDNVVVMINGERKLIKPNKVFSGPVNLASQPGFKLLGKTKAETNDKSERSEKSIKFEIQDYNKPFIDFDFIDEAGFPKISICIVTKDGYKVIRECLESIKKFVKYPKFEVLLCDTGSTQEGIKELYEEYAIAWGDKFKVFWDHKYNFSKNNNFLAKESTGDLLLFMNNDVFLTYDAISEMVKYSLCSNIGCLGHRLVWEADQKSIQHDGQVIYHPNGQWYGPGHHNYKGNLDAISKQNARVEGVTAAFMMLRKSIFNKVKGFDEGYIDVFQDVDLNLKVGKLGYVNFCIREKAIIHVDHSTRKEDATKDSITDLQKLQRDWFFKGPFPVKEKAKNSILICATKKDQMQTLVKSIKSRESYEFIFVNNTENYFWCPEALNQLTKVSEGEMMYHMHQDVTFDSNEPFATIRNVSKQLGDFGVLGPAGVQVGGKGAIRGVDFSSLDYNFDYMRVQTIDEFCLISKRSSNLKFGEYLDHFHFYGGDICMEANKKNLTNYVVKVPITHHSGGDVNLTTGDGYEHYLKQGRKFYKKWHKSYPNISTTTVHFRPTGVFWFLGAVLKLSPTKEVIDVNNIDETPNKKKYLLEI